MKGVGQPGGTSARDVVVIGASAGGVEALKQLAARLPADLPAAIAVVLHVPARGISVLPDILGRAGPLPAAHARDGERLERGRIYVAPPDHHLLVAGRTLRVERGPRENGHRPSVDPLFRTAARELGARVVGIVLSGALDDGTVGLGEIKRRGGLTIVQDPEEALYPGMPESAIGRGRPDLVLGVAEIAAVLATLGSPGDDTPPDELEEETMDPVDTDWSRDDVLGGRADGTVSRFTCPECSGTLWEVGDGGLVKLRCRVGHAYTEQAFLDEQARSLEGALWTAATTLEEKADFTRRLSQRFDDAGQPFAAARYREQTENALAQVALVRRALEALEAPPAAEELQAS